MYSRAILTFYFLISVLTMAYAQSAKGELMRNSRGFYGLLADKIERKFEEYTLDLTKWLEGFNDRNLGNSTLGRLLHYEDFKPNLELADTGARGSRMKKMGMAMMPLIFHMGATSTWMLVTALMTAKSVTIGLTLLIFKIAVTSAKVASFFTNMKKHENHGWASWTPHYEHHGHKRGFSDGDQIEHQTHIEHYPHTDYQPHESYSAYGDWNPSDYHTLPSLSQGPEPYAEHPHDERRKNTVV